MDLIDHGSQRSLIEAEIARIVSRRQERMKLPPPDLSALKSLAQGNSPGQLLRGVGAWGDLARSTLYVSGLDTFIPEERHSTDSVQWLAAKTVIEELKPQFRDMVWRCLQDWDCYRQWSKQKIVYPVDPDLHEALIDTAQDDEIPGEVLRQLPHPDPLILFPQGVPVVLNSGETGLMRGFFVRGYRRVQATLDDGTPGLVQRISTSTAAEDIEGLQLCGFSSIDGQPGEVDMSYVHVPASGTFTIQDAAAESAGTFSVQMGIAEASQEARLEWITRLMNICLPVLLYACSADNDIQQKPRAPKPKTKPKDAPLRSNRPRGEADAREARVLALGYRIGPALGKARRMQAEGISPVPTGRKLPTHTRKGHFHTFRVGQGRRMKRIRWLKPITVNDTGEAAALPTLIPIEKEA